MTRSRLYILIDSFENDLRRSFTHYVLDHLDEVEALGVVYSKVNDRREATDIASGVSIVEFLHLQEAYDLLNQHRDSLPAELGRELRQNVGVLAELVSIRNRVMHGRPLSPGDAEKAVSCCRLYVTRYWQSTRETLDHLVADPQWEPSFSLGQKFSERILHNLPLPEYDETGLIGRNATCQKILKQLLRRREPIITIVGEGGIGKTAVALEVAYSILDHPESPYECILWTSLKTERLTADGVMQIAGAARDVTGVAQTLGAAIDESFTGGIEELANALDGIDTLLVIDNLETVSGSEVIALYDALPDSVTYLFTSRIGIGQFERRVPLEPLKESDSEFLFRNFARSRGVERLASVSKSTVQEVVARLRHSPLAIRWYVLSVEAGRQPLEALANQDELLAFCVESVYKSFSADPQTVLAMLFALDRSATYDELVVFAEMGPDRLRRAVQSLLSGSMVSLESDLENPLVSRVRLTEAARHFLRKISPPNAEMLDRTAKQESDFRKSEESRRADELARQLAPNVVRVRSSHDAPTAHLLRLALLACRRRNVEQALEYIARARTLNPEYWEVDRVEAFIHSVRGQVEQATAMYRSALRRAEDEESRAVVAYFFAGHLARKAHDPAQSLEFAEIAHRYFQSSDTSQQLGLFLIWSRRFVEGQEYLEAALDMAEGRVRLITLTSLAESWRRWAEFLMDNERKYSEAAQKAYAGFSLGVKELQSGVVDNKLAAAVLESGSTFIRAVTASGISTNDYGRQLGEILRLVASHEALFRDTAPWRHFPGYVGKLYRGVGLDDRIRGLCEPLVMGGERSRSSIVEVGEVKLGKVCQWRQTYGFIEHQDYPDNVFFPATVVDDLAQRGERIDLTGRYVKFVVEESPGSGRLRASWVSLSVLDEI
ncbi:NB-ARC domain-containing protein [Micromonospora sp. NPDC049257]|uniref:NB-ARC domain-containing protein n=1 Tax=Micromonospora sp. NPDC049257 TaxID=3155771 RepID=UPI00343425BE